MSRTRRCRRCSTTSTRGPTGAPLALDFEGETLDVDASSHAERVNRLARSSDRRGVGPESLVALGMRRSLELVVGMHAVLAAGGAYVPIDPDHPAERTAYILDSATPVCVLTTSGATVRTCRTGLRRRRARHASTCPASPPSRSPTPSALAPLRPANTAYVIFTSGSTGRPKGVAVTHSRDRQPDVLDVARVPARRRRRLPAEDRDHLRRVAVGLLPAVRVRGATGRRDAGRAPRSRVCGRHDRAPRRDRDRLRAVDADRLRRPRGCGDSAGRCATSSSSARRCRRRPRPTSAGHRDAGLHNLYGPTEAAVSVTYWQALASRFTAPVPIGVPEWNVQVYVLDSRLRPSRQSARPASCTSPVASSRAATSVARI